jgi:hypothetical protein
MHVSPPLTITNPLLNPVAATLLDVDRAVERPPTTQSTMLVKE